MVEELDASGDYPSFKRFAEFLKKESKIACNPVTASLFLSCKVSEDKFPKRVKALNTTDKVKGAAPKTQEFNQMKPCSVCESETHYIAKCPTFAAKSTDDKRAFILEKRLCFGCLRTGHITKTCKKRHTCGTCGLRHPTCLHEDRIKGAVKALRSDAEVETSQEVQNVMSYALTQRASATSSIVPVLISTGEEPQNEILTYALTLHPK